MAEQLLVYTQIELQQLAQTHAKNGGELVVDKVTWELAVTESGPPMLLVGYRTLDGPRSGCLRLDTPIRKETKMLNGDGPSAGEVAFNRVKDLAKQLRIWKKGKGRNRRPDSEDFECLLCAAKHLVCTDITARKDCGAAVVSLRAVQQLRAIVVEIENQRINESSRLDD